MSLDKPTYIKAIKALVSGNIGGYNDGPIEKIKFFDGQTPPSEEEIQKKLAELQAAEPMRLLREKRDRILSQTDWRDLPIHQGTNQEAWRTYRQQLRDMPSTTDPSNPTWPTAPENN